MGLLDTEVSVAGLADQRYKLVVSAPFVCTLVGSVPSSLWSE